MIFKNTTKSAPFRLQIRAWSGGGLFFSVNQPFLTWTMHLAISWQLPMWHKSLSWSYRANRTVTPDRRTDRRKDMWKHYASAAFGGKNEKQDFSDLGDRCISFHTAVSQMVTAQRWCYFQPRHTIHPSSTPVSEATACLCSNVDDRSLDADRLSAHQPPSRQRRTDVHGTQTKHPLPSHLIPPTVKHSSSVAAMQLQNQRFSLALIQDCPCASEIYST